ncbi:hypothetical protein KEM56_006998 [Ascosphaera pollenicola]|nr:hypothetical protein KEM56_006998 [Ascosphaera pollenicola]
MPMLKVFAARSPRPLFFSMAFISSLAAKTLHVGLHAKTIPFLDLLVFIPTVFLQDVVFICLERVLLHGSGGILSVIGAVVGAFFSILTFVGCSCLFGFWFVTGSEIQWSAAGSVTQDPAAMKMMASGTIPVTISGIVLFTISLLSTPYLYNKIGSCLTAISLLFYPRNWKMCIPGRQGSSKSEDTEGLIAPIAIRRTCRIWPIIFLALTIATIVLTCVRPTVPYHHISLTLPVAMLGMVSSDDRKCLTTGPLFPFLDLVDKQFWEEPRGEYNGWAPGSHNEWVERYETQRPDWLPKELPKGFWRWQKFDQGGIQGHRVREENECEGGDDGFYNPVTDPSRISNLDLQPLPELQKVFDDKSGAVITHVVLITLESTRKELFPIQKGSYLYNEAVKSWGDKPPADLDERYNLMTRVAQQVTGDRFFPDDDPLKPLKPVEGEWQDYVAPDMGGISVRGALTGSTLSFKSVLGSHCGVGPLTENFLEEVTTDIYQPCLPQIFKLFNNIKNIKNEPEVDPDDLNAHNISSIGHDRKSIHERKWKSVFMQAVTDTYDRQDKQNKQIGFDAKLAKSDIERASSKFWPPMQAAANYFGYSEEEIMPYLRDAIETATANKERLFLSHFTSSTHHPWVLPENFDHTEYFGPRGSHESMDKFFNVNHFSDVWLGKVLNLLNETGIANETLVVIVGDHGQAFKEDSEMTGAYENPHISNFRVPIVFRHPHLPRVHVEANATSISILPTILDLLVKTNSLGDKDTIAAKHLVHEYEGQSLIRPYISSKNGRQAWNFGTINAGGTMLAVSSAASPYRLIVPLVDSFGYRFTNTKTDPVEKDPMEGWSISELAETVVKKYGEEAKKWLYEADAIARWWSSERHRLYHYSEKKSD